IVHRLVPRPRAARLRRIDARLLFAVATPLAAARQAPTLLLVAELGIFVVQQRARLADQRRTIEIDLEEALRAHTAITTAAATAFGRQALGDLVADNRLATLVAVAQHDAC